MGLSVSVAQFFVVFFIFDITYSLASLEELASVPEDARFTREVQDYVSWLSRMESMGYNSNNVELEPKYGTSKDSGDMNQNLIIVSQTPGIGNFQLIQDAIDSIPKGNTQRVIIQIDEGTYREKLKIPKKKPYITFLGAGINKTKITWDDNAAKTGTTYTSATVSVMSDGFIAKGIAFENSSPPPVPGIVGGQAVAFQISGDHGAIYDCAFYGAQDTLYDHKGRHYFKNCFIQGSVDFIFGDGQSIYQACELRTINTNAGSLTAQKRKLGTEPTGFVFLNCTVSGVGMVILGRAWAAYSRVVFIFSYLDNIILPAGWNDWGIPDRQKTAFYGEYKCFGPGADRRSRVAWSYELTDAQVGPFLSLDFIDANSWLTSSP